MYHGACKIIHSKIKELAVNKYYVLALCLSIHVVSGMKRQHDWNAQKYQQRSELQFLDNIALTGNEKVLDIGSGDGRITTEIAKRVPRGSVKGIDIADILNVKYPYTKIGDGGFHDQYNLVTVFSSLSCIPYEDQKTAFNNIALLLTYKGKVRVRLAHEDSPCWRAYIAVQKHDKWKQFFVDYEIPFYPTNEEKVRNWLKLVGLKEEYVDNMAGVRKIEEAPHTFTCRQEFLDWMSTFPAQVDKVPQELHEQFFNNIIDTYLEEVPQEEDGSIKLSIPALAVCAQFFPDGWCG
jgi:trans-aconitate 2-methyltransferase